jgi:hypothetical protein
MPIEVTAIVVLYWVTTIGLIVWLWRRESDLEKK